MKKLLILLALLFCVPAAYAEGDAREYAEYLESALPGAAFQDAEMPAEWTEKLGEEYELIARSDAVYGTYIAAVRKGEGEERYYGVEETAAHEGESRFLIVEDANGNELERIDLGADWDIRPYGYGEYLLIYQVGSCSEDLFLAGTEDGRARLAFRNGNGFVARDPEKAQIGVMVHSGDSWRSGATNEPIMFYIDAPSGLQLIGDESVPRAEAFQKWDVIPLGVYVYEGEECYELVVSPDGKTGVLDSENLCSAGSDYARVLDLAELALGYRPGEMDFIGKDVTRAAFTWEGGETVVTDADALAAIRDVLQDADCTVGSVKCPSPAFLVLEFADGTKAELAVAINSFDLFFYRGVCFKAGEGEKFLELFGVKDTEFYRERFGE